MRECLHYLKNEEISKENHYALIIKVFNYIIEVRLYHLYKSLVYSIFCDWLFIGHNFILDKFSFNIKFYKIAIQNTLKILTKKQKQSISLSAREYEDELEKGNF